MGLHGNLEAMLREVEAFVALNLMWYVKEGCPEECAAPDVMVAFGRPKGDRRSYNQWEENSIAPHIIFEIVSPDNTGSEMDDKEAFYADHSVEEYYVYDPDKDYLSAYLRQGTVLRRKWFQKEFVSPRLGIRFDLSGAELQVFYPDGRRFLTFAELEADRSTQRQLRQTAEENVTRLEQLATHLAHLGKTVRLGQASLQEIAELERLEKEAEGFRS